MEQWLERFALANFRRSADTAHDLKTPLNIAVLHLELLRMRLRKISGKDDDRVDAHTRAIEAELRKLGHIFDAFFVLSTPPPDGLPVPVDLGPIVTAAADATGLSLEFQERVWVDAHEGRLAEMFKLFFHGTRKVIADDGLAIAHRRGPDAIVVEVAGRAVEVVEPAKLFKFYYTDREGKSDLSLAVARLIAETYGGDLTTSEEADRIVFRLSLPLGER